MLHAEISLLVGLTLQKSASFSQWDCFTWMSWQCFEFSQPGERGSEVCFLCSRHNVVGLYKQRLLSLCFPLLNHHQVDSRLQNIVSLIPFGVSRINGFATMTSNKPSTCQHSVCRTEAVLFCLSTPSLVRRFTDREELRDLLECISMGRSAAIKPQHLNQPLLRSKFS